MNEVSLNLEFEELSRQAVDPSRFTYAVEHRGCSSNQHCCLKRRAVSEACYWATRNWKSVTFRCSENGDCSLIVSCSIPCPFLALSSENGPTFPFFFPHFPPSAASTEYTGEYAILGGLNTLLSLHPGSRKLGSPKGFEFPA